MVYLTVQNRINRARSYGYQQGYRHGAILYGTEAGLSASTLSNRLGISERTVKNIRMRLRNNIHLGIRLGRPRNTTIRANRRLVRLARQWSRFSSPRLLELWGEPVSSWTVRRRLAELGIHPFRQLRKPLLNPINIEGRLNWAMARVTWLNTWERVVFSDESRFCLHESDGRVRIWRSIGQRFLPEYIEELPQAGHRSLLVWGAIWMNGKSVLQIIPGAVNGNSYTQIMQTFLNTSQPPLDFLFQDDNAPPHRALEVIQFKNNMGIRSLRWPSRSPDLNPIENLWSFLSRKVKESAPINMIQLRQVLVQQWANIPQLYINRLILSMRNRIGEVIRNRGGHTHY